MMQLGGLWLNESRGGEKYMVGYLGNLKLLVFKNKYKENDTQPDYIMYVDEKKRTNGDDGDGGASGTSNDVEF